MLICSCNVFSDHQVRAIADTARSVSEVYECLGCKPCCGVCARTIRKVLAEAKAEIACGCDVICPPDSTDCPVIERTIEIVREWEIGYEDAAAAPALGLAAE